MRIGRWMIGCVGGGCCLVVLSGCISLQEHNRFKAAQRSLVAEKEALAQELFDARNVTDSLRSRVGSLESELETKGELVANLRQENELLDEMRKTMQGTLEEVAGAQVLSPIAVTGPKLPAALDNALKRFANEHPSHVEYDQSGGTVKWKSDLLFAFASDIVKQSSMEALRSFTDVLKSQAAAGFEVIVVGHTDNVPIVTAATKAKHPTNWHLSGHRAIAVAKVLKKFGYAPGRIGVMGYGEYRPVADNSTPDGAGKNRRVEIYLIPKDAIVKSITSAGWRVRGEALAFARLVP